MAPTDMPLWVSSALRVALYDWLSAFACERFFALSAGIRA